MDSPRRSSAASEPTPWQGLISQDVAAHRHLSTLCYCLALFVAGTSVNVLGPAGPTLARHVHVTSTAIGNVFTGEGLGNTLGSSIVGPMLARHSGHAIITALGIVLFFAVAAVPACESLTQVFALYVGIGSCLGLINGACNTMITWVQHGRNVGPWVNLVNASFGLGGVSAPLIFLGLERHLGNGLAGFSSIGLLACAVGIFAATLQSPREPPPPPPPDDDGDGSPLLAEVGMPKRRSTLGGVDLGSREAYVRCTVVAPLLAVITLGVGAEIAFSAWVYPYAVERAGMRVDEAAYLSSLYWTCFTVGRMCMAPLASCFSAGALLLPTLACNVAAVVLIALQPESRVCLWIGTAAAGVGVCALFSNVISLLASYGLLSPKIMGVVGTAAAVGHMTLPNIVGRAISWSSYKYDAFIYIEVGCNVAVFVLAVGVVLHLWRSFTPTSGIGSASHDRKRVVEVEMTEAI